MTESDKQKLAELEIPIKDHREKLDYYLNEKYKILYGYKIGDYVINRNDDYYLVVSFDSLKCQFRGIKKRKDGQWGIREEYFDNPLEYPDTIISRPLTPEEIQKIK